MSDAKRPAGRDGVMDVRALNRALLARQYLLQRERMEPAEAVERLVGLQAQEPQDPYIALLARVDGFDPTELSSLIESRRAARLAVLRGTLHLLTDRDVVALRPALQPVMTRALHSGSPFGRRLAGVDIDAVVEMARGLYEEAPRTLAELRPLLAERWPQADAQALGYAAHYSLPLVQIPPRGLWRRSGRAVCTTAERWLGRPLGPPADTESILRRYLAAFGPAAPRDFRTWSGLPGAAAAFDAIRDELVSFRGEDGGELFDLPDAPRPPAETPAPVRFLGEYDNVFLSHADRRRIAGNGPAMPPSGWRRVLTIDGFVAGRWQLDSVGERSVMRVRVGADLPPAVRDQLLEEGERLMEVMAPESTTRRSTSKGSSERAQRLRRMSRRGAAGLGARPALAAISASGGTWRLLSVPGAIIAAGSASSSIPSRCEACYSQRRSFFSPPRREPSLSGRRRPARLAPCSTISRRLPAASR